MKYHFTSLKLVVITLQQSKILKSTEALPLVLTGVEAGSKSRGLATPMKTLAHIFVSLIEFMLEKMSLNFNYIMLNGKTNCAFKPPSTLHNSGKYRGLKKTIMKLLCFA